VIFSCTSADAGCYVKGEKPDPLQYQFQKADGTPLGDLTGYAVKLLLREQYSDPAGAATFNGSVADPLLSVVQYNWVGTEWTGQGQWLAQFWIGNGVMKYASVVIKHSVSLSIGPVPSV
jgi:hypothetical protein